MPYIEFEETNVDLAVLKACKELKIDKKNLKYDIISYGSSGIFGLVGVKKAKLRVHAPDNKNDKTSKKSAPKKASQKKTPSSKKDNDNDGKTDPTQVQASETLPDSDGTAVEDIETKSTGDPDANTGDSPGEADPITNDTEQGNGSVSDTDTRTDPDTETIAESAVDPEPAPEQPTVDASTPAPEPADTTTTQDAEADDKEDEPQKEFKIDDELVEAGRITLEKIVLAISDDSQVSVEIKKQRLFYNIKDGNTGALIGKRGATLEAIQYIIEKVINTKSQKRVSVQIDVEGYLVKKRAALRSLAHKMASKAKKTGKPAYINQMNSFDRKIVHLALKDDREVKTQSSGDGYYRKVIIIPKNQDKKRKTLNRQK